MSRRPQFTVRATKSSNPKPPPVTKPIKDKTKLNKNLQKHQNKPQPVTKPITDKTKPDKNLQKPSPKNQYDDVSIESQKNGNHTKSSSSTLTHEPNADAQSVPEKNNKAPKTSSSTVTINPETGDLESPPSAKKMKPNAEFTDPRVLEDMALAAMNFGISELANTTNKEEQRLAFVAFGATSLDGDTLSELITSSNKAIHRFATVKAALACADVVVEIARCVNHATTQSLLVTVSPESEELSILMAM
jgi:hypothetical protein